MFYIIYNKICIEGSSIQLGAMKHCVELNTNKSSSALWELEA